MKNGKSMKQTLDIFTKIFFSFSLVFLFYFTCQFVDSFAYNYFIFPLIAITIIFACGINIGKSLEKLKRNEQIGFLLKGNIKAITNMKQQMEKRIYS